MATLDVERVISELTTGEKVTLTAGMKYLIPNIPLSYITIFL